MRRFNPLPLLLVLTAIGCGRAARPPEAAGATVTPAPAAPTTVVPPASSPGAPATPTSAASPGAPAVVDVAAAVAMLRSGRESDLLRARRALDEIVVASPNDAHAWYNLGVARHRLGMVLQAAEAFQRATAILPTLAEGWRSLGLVESELGETSLALAHLEKALKLAPDDLAARVGQVAALRAVGRSAEAVERAKEILATDAKSLPAYTQMGLAHLETGRPELARFVFEKAETVEGAESDPTIQANFGWALVRAGERYAGEKRIVRAVELDPGFVPGLVYLARLYLEDENFADAVALLERARARAPRNHGVLVDLGVAYRGVGRSDDAKRIWEEALGVDPRDPTPLFDLGILLADAFKDYDGGIAKLQAYVAAGGAASAEATAFIERIGKDKAAAERARAREEERRRRESEKAERERILREADKQRQQASPPPAPASVSPWGAPAGPSGAAPSPAAPSPAAPAAPSPAAPSPAAPSPAAPSPSPAPPTPAPSPVPSAPAPAPTVPAPAPAAPPGAPVPSPWGGPSTPAAPAAPSPTPTAPPQPEPPSPWGSPGGGR